MKQGFTLVELLVVVLIVGVLSALALPQYTTAIERARASEALTLMEAVQGAAERYRFQHDTWPLDFSELDVSIPFVEDSTTERGGKNFSLQIGTTSSTTYYIVATRLKLSDEQGGYALRTKMVDDAANETITSTRYCTVKDGAVDNVAAPSLGTKARTICDAITGGKNPGF